MRHQVLLWKMKIATPAPDASGGFSSTARTGVRRRSSALSRTISMNKLHSNREILRAVYKDPTRITEFADTDIVLHKADQGAGGGLSIAIGKDAVLSHEINLLRRTRQTLYMDVHDIIANDHFGSVVGDLRARCEGRRIIMPFCGLWRFRDGKIIEHWENVYDVRALGNFMNGKEPVINQWLYG
ncbi:nuclear transport factor 2 family protein [Pseudomonas syringae]|nr:nuclear transport factor 2 family protein [Pseudomonas syringae]MCF5242758.1 nuclear transport factor 2 family protein [Pseudomonas syringae]